MASDSPVVFFHYVGSPYAQRVLYYLALRGISYDQCMQPNVLPRPDLARLGIRYRRIPLLAIGRDVYLDSRLILQRLEQHGGSKPSFADRADPEQRGLQQLCASFTTNTGLFMAIVQLLLPKTPMMTDEAFMQDRAEMIGAGPGFDFADFVLKTRPDAITAVKNALEFLETTLLADGRQWIAGTEQPTLADIEMVWPFAWLFAIPGAIEEPYISKELFPKAFGWVERFQKAYASAQGSSRSPESLSGDQVAELLGKAAADQSVTVEQNDPLVKTQGLREGQVVQVWPTDSGAGHKTVGKLVGLNSKEVVVETTEGDVSVRVHAPRQGFRVAAQEKANLS